MNTFKNKQPMKKAQLRTPKKELSTVESVPSKYLSWIILAILFVTFIAYTPSLRNDILKTWDDQAYVTQNDLIKELTPAGIVRIFKEDRGLYANYHPLTTLSLAINHVVSGTSPMGYHLTNLLLHLLNTFLVFIFILLLPGRRIFAASIIALLFGIHPMHVESVAWISERKDVLYTLFFLGSLVSYQQYLMRNDDLKWYLLALFLFTCSLLSKAMAASLPVVLLMVDYVNNRKWNIRVLFEKVPFFLFAIGFGILAMKIQAEGNATSSDLFSLSSRILHAGYGFIIYIVKILVPTGLSAFYPYPYPLVNSAWVLNQTPSVLFVTMLLSIILLGLLVILIIRNVPKSKIYVFGFLFYLGTIALVLQFIPVGRAIMADRYSYLASIGVFIIIGFLADHFILKKNVRVIVISIVLIYTGVLAVMTFERTKVWENDETLWTDVMLKYPNDNRIMLPIANRANYYYMEKRMPEALQDYLLAASINPNDDVMLEKIGRIYGKEMNRMDSSMYYLQKAYEKNKSNFDVLTGLGVVYGMRGDLRKSLDFSLQAMQINGNDPSLLTNIGVSYQNLGEPEKAKEFFDKAEKNNASMVKVK
jgi:tetratricopeptide (TPR) repeat protein